MWVEAKKSGPIVGIEYNAVKVQIHRKTAKFQYRYVDGIGRGGRKLEIWIDDNQIETPKTKTSKQPPKKNFALSEKAVPKMNNFLRLTRSEQKEVLNKIELVKSYVEREKWMTYEEWAQGRENIPTKQHLLRLANLYKQGIKDQTLLNLFCDTRGRPRGSTKLTTEMQEMAQRYILRRDIHPNDIGIYTLMKYAYKDALPSCDTVCRYLKRFREDNKMIVAFAKDPDRARGKYRAAFGNASQKAKYKNHYWELDGTPADVITSDGKRWTIIGAIDIYSRRVVLTLEEYSNSYALARNLREGILKLGVPENVITDNGRDYKSNHFESVCQMLHINKKEVPPYSGWCKPFIERFFGTMTRELFRGLEGFCGHNVSERSAIQNSLSFEKKQEARKRWRAQKHTEKSFVQAMLNKDNTLGVFVPLSPEELKAYLTNWVENVYEQRVHGGIDTTPILKYQNDLTPANTIDDPRMLDVLLGEWEERTVGKEGIVMRRDGKEAQYTHTALIDYIGERVYVALGADMGEIKVYSSEMAPICTATDVSLEGISREAMKKISREMGKIERESMRLAQRADELAQKLGDPTIKDVIGASKPAKVLKRTKGHKVDVELPQERANEAAMNGDKPFFTSAFDMFVWHIEHGREDEINPEILNEQSEIYELAKNEVEYRTKSKVG